MLFCVFTAGVSFLRKIMVGKVYFVFLRFEENSGNAFNAKIKEPRVQTQFLLAGVERFELPDDGVRVRSLTAWRYPNIRRIALASTRKNNSAFI